MQRIKSKNIHKLGVDVQAATETIGVFGHNITNCPYASTFLIGLTFGKITTTSNDMRELQFASKLNF